MEYKLLPQALTWSEAKSYCTFKNVDLPNPKQLMEWAKTHQANVDIWTSEENHHDPESAKCWSGKYLTIKPKEKAKKCLLLLLMK
ncbi:MAG: hypothetical protein ACPGED_04385 [Flavobacteriales bacterium]